MVLRVLSILSRLNKPEPFNRCRASRDIDSLLILSLFCLDRGQALSHYVISLQDIPTMEKMIAKKEVKINDAVPQEIGGGIKGAPVLHCPCRQP